MHRSFRLTFLSCILPDGGLLRTRFQKKEKKKTSNSVRAVREDDRPERERSSLFYHFFSIFVLNHADIEMFTLGGTSFDERSRARARARYQF